MAGTKIGGQKAAMRNKTRHGSDFYARIGAIGGKKGTTGGFAANRELARQAGAKGGRVSRRRKVEELQVIETAQKTTKNDFELAA